MSLADIIDWIGADGLSRIRYAFNWVIHANLEVGLWWLVWGGIGLVVLIALHWGLERVLDFVIHNPKLTPLFKASFWILVCFTPIAIGVANWPQVPGPGEWGNPGSGEWGYELSACQDEVFADLMEPADLIWIPGTELHEGDAKLVRVGGAFTRVDTRTGTRKSFRYDCTARNRQILSANVN